ncbi:helix-turn-helix transcriptional regulator [Gudongella sp. DL1XJH-153]|uniref:helix-turn-helix transcriptional regulator n=1 Tax=Gudongella sp. DL1XJH-153 TaxID=3409804 RepID=UPI003BB78C55
MNLKVKLKRIEKGFKQNELAEMIGITPQYLRLIEIGQANPTKDIMKKISDILETSAEELFFEEVN